MPVWLETTAADDATAGRAGTTPTAVEREGAGGSSGDAGEAELNHRNLQVADAKEYARAIASIHPPTWRR